MQKKKVDNMSRGGKQSFTVQDEIRRDRQMRRARKLRMARSRARGFLTFALCTAIGLLLVTAVGVSVLRVKTADVVGNQRYSAEEILSAAKLEGEALLLIGDKTVYNRVTEKCPYVESVELVKTYPSAITVNVIETEATYALSLHGRTLTLDKSLRVMDYTDNIDGLIFLTLPEIKSAIEGKRIVFANEAEEKDALFMLDAFFVTGDAHYLTALDISERFSISAEIKDVAKITFGDYRNIADKLRIANQLLADAKAEYARFATIDVSVLSQASLKLEY